jgi:hypothetical protein
MEQILVLAMHLHRTYRQAIPETSPPVQSLSERPPGKDRSWNETRDETWEEIRKPAAQFALEILSQSLQLQRVRFVNYAFGGSYLYLLPFARSLRQRADAFLLKHHSSTAAHSI